MFPQKPLEVISVRASWAARYHFEERRVSYLTKRDPRRKKRKQEENDTQLPEGLTKSMSILMLSQSLAIKRCTIRDYSLATCLATLSNVWDLRMKIDLFFALSFLFIISFLILECASFNCIINSGLSTWGSSAVALIIIDDPSSCKIRNKNETCWYKLNEIVQSIASYLLFDDTIGEKTNDS